jgi:hypothetical protein
MLGSYNQTNTNQGLCNRGKQLPLLVANNGKNRTACTQCQGSIVCKNTKVVCYGGKNQIVEQTHMNVLENRSTTEYCFTLAEDQMGTYASVIYVLFL